MYKFKYILLLNMERKLKITALILLILTIIWVILTAVSMSGIDPAWSNLEYVKWVADPDPFFTMNYVNVTLLTIVLIFLFSYLFNYLKDQHRKGAIVGLIFIPIYGIINLICYSIQISIVPSIARTALENQDNVLIASELIQANPSSLIGFLNGLAYAILGIPSIIYGILLFRKSKKFSGIFLLLNGILCIIGIVGYALDHAVISLGVMIGGIFFLISLLFMVIEFKSESG